MHKTTKPEKETREERRSRLHAERAFNDLVRRAKEKGALIEPAPVTSTAKLFICL